MRLRISDFGFRIGAAAMLALLVVACKRERAAEPVPPCCAAKAATQPDTRPIVFGVNEPFCDKTGSPCVGKGHYRSYDGLAKLMGDAAGRPVELRYFATEPLLIAAAKNGELDGVICKAWPALRAGKATGRPLHRLVDLAMPAWQHNRPTTAPAWYELESRFGAEIFTLANSGIRELKDLNGKRLAVGNEDSYEKSFSVRALLARAGVKPVLVLKPTCLSAALAVKEGDADAATLSRYAYYYGTLEATEMPPTRVVASTESIPYVTLAVCDTMPAATRDRLRSLLHALCAPPGGPGSPLPSQPADLGLTRILKPVEWNPAELKDAP